MEEKKTILIVEDDADINALLHTALTKAGYDTIQAYSGTEGKLVVGMHERKIDLILLDLMLPGMSGEELLSTIRAQGQTPVIVLTATSWTTRSACSLRARTIILPSLLRYRRCSYGFRYSSDMRERKKNLTALYTEI